MAFFTGDAVQSLAIIVMVVSLYYIVSGLVRKDLNTLKMIGIYVAIVAGFITLGLVVLNVGSPLNYYILAGAWLLHATWDVHLFRKNTIVPRWMTEFCFVYDTIVAITLITLAILRQY